MTVRVLIADDQALIRGGLVALFTAAPGIEVVGEAADGARAVELAAETKPDLVLMDIRMPVLDGIGATRQILSAASAASSASAAAPASAASGSGDAAPPRIMVLTTFDLDEYVYAALAEGAAGFLLKDTPPERILSAVHTIMAGDVLITPRITQRLIENSSRHHRVAAVARPQLDQLTAREIEVLRLVGMGLSNSEIADRLVLSEATVKTHVKHVMSKLGLNSRAQAVVVAYETGLVVPGS
ncbi:LuxR C-terminal-related transcriptional regulator [Cryptosporangium phraense]|uniref:Response regulator transcription factor n=1 Tax=Cryptosporangium phraense TaxID=2593070 RepID=A0A545AUN7_9ACTN|nr:response regulator transcription factor [Cryptosporangium phraense]TQS45047.1 response regulator transcription factor [Cryptosporangium phraense]